MKRNQGERKERVTLNSINTEFEDFCNMVKTNIHQKERQLLAWEKTKEKPYQISWSQYKPSPIKCDMTLETEYGGEKI